MRTGPICKNCISRKFLDVWQGIPYVYPIESEHVIWHEEFHGELDHQTCGAVLPHREDGFVWVVGQSGQVLAFLVRQHQSQRQNTWPQGGVGKKRFRIAMKHAESAKTEFRYSIKEICSIGVATTRAAARRCPRHLWTTYVYILTKITADTVMGHAVTTTHGRSCALTQIGTHSPQRVVTTHKGALTKHGKLRKSGALRVAKTKPSHCSQRPQFSR